MVVILYLCSPAKIKDDIRQTKLVPVCSLHSFFRIGEAIALDLLPDHEKLLPMYRKRAGLLCTGVRWNAASPNQIRGEDKVGFFVLFLHGTISGVFRGEDVRTLIEEDEWMTNGGSHILIVTLFNAGHRVNNVSSSRSTLPEMVLHSLHSRSLVTQ